MPSPVITDPAHDDVEGDLCRVLIVEDSAEASQFLGLALKRDGHDVETARNGTEGLSVAVAYRPHVVLIDVGLPGLDGLQVAKQLRGVFPRILIIATTGRSSPEDIHQSLEAGCNHHLVKPIDLQIMRELLDHWKCSRGCND